MQDTDTLRALKAQLLASHYTHSIPSGKSWYFSFETAIVCFALPPSPYVSRFLIGEPNKVLELSRLWAPDGHEPNLLTRAIAYSVSCLRAEARQYEALVSYADPNVGHEGGVYRAASWVYLGSCEESRYYRNALGQVVSRRKFHSGSKHLTKSQIEAKGFAEFKMPGKHRFARGLTNRARKAIERIAA